MLRIEYKKDGMWHSEDRTFEDSEEGRKVLQTVIDRLYKRSGLETRTVPA